MSFIISHSSLLNKRLVLIGGTTGMGRSAARAFVKNGAKIIVVGLDETSVAETKTELGDHADGFAADARDPLTAERAIALCLEKWSGFDGLFHVAGGSGRKMGDGPLHELTLDGWQATLDLNLTSLMLANQAAVRQFLKQKTGGGSILNMGSVLGFSPSPAHFSTHAYAAAKAAVVGFSKTIAAFYASENIRVNVVAPALVDTPMAQRAAQNPEIQQFISKKQPLDGGRIGRPDDLDGLAVYFMSDLSRFTTGQVVAVDGGWSLGF